MKKLFTLALALMGIAGAANAATEDDLKVLKHSYVLVCDEVTGTSDSGAGVRPGAGVLFGADHFLDMYKDGTTANNKGKVDLSQLDPAEDADGNPLPQYVTQDIVDKYGADYGGPHYNCLRLKNAQDVIALKLTANSKIIIFEQGNNKEGKDARIPCIARNVDDIKNKTGLNPAPTAGHPKTVSGYKWEYTVDDDGLYYIGSYNGDMFVSFIIIEANEAPGTPSLKVGEQQFVDGLWFKEVTCKAVEVDGFPTIVTYTLDGSQPTASSTVYTEPIKCYKNMDVKFQAYMDLGTGTVEEEAIMPNADNEANVSFKFDAPAIEADGATFAITSPYAQQNGTNYYTLNGGEAIQGDGATLTESATVTAYTVISNGTYGSFTSNKVSKDVYVLNPIKEKKVIQVIAGDVVLDEEATAQSTTGEVFRIEGGEISADKSDFFVKNLTFKAMTDEQYQVPEGNERYIQMSNTNITFQVAEGDEVAVKVTCSKNSCKNIDAADAEDGSQVNDRKCYVNVSGTNYAHTDAEGNELADQKLYPGEANIIEFTLTGGTYTFQKYSGTGNIFISSIEFTPKATAVIGDLNGDGRVNSSDVQKTYGFMAAGETGQTVPAADLNGDGLINSGDVQKLYGIMASQTAE